MKSLVDVAAPAKLNLFLHVLGRRPEDGYHLLQSAFILIDWADTLHFDTLEDGRIERVDLNTPLPPEDLCLRAAKLLQKTSGTRLGVRIAIHKQVPWGAGLGGGSSDAASTLLALNRLWHLNWSKARLAELGLQLGADVPFFIGGQNAWVEGVGEHLTPIRWPATPYAVLKPDVEIATPDIFKAPDLDRANKAATIIDFLAQASLEGFFGRNNLQAVAVRLYPQVQLALDWLGSHVGPARMTGSGSAVFARINVDNNGSSEPSAPGVLQTLPASWIYRSCKSLEQHPLFDWAH